MNDSTVIIPVFLFIKFFKIFRPLFVADYEVVKYGFIEIPVIIAILKPYR